MRRVCGLAALILPVLLFSVSASAQPDKPKSQPPSATPASSDQVAPTPAPAATTAKTSAPAAIVPTDPLIPPSAAASPPASTLPADPSAHLPGSMTGMPQVQGEIGAKPSDVFAEDWWNMARPVVELHGYYRLRTELFYNFALGRVDPPSSAYWPQSADNAYNDYANRQTNPHDVPYCGSDPTQPGAKKCSDTTQAGANMRFRLNPELHISDNLRILAQIDLLDNVVLGSTSDAVTNQPLSAGKSGYAPISFMSTTQNTPVTGVNSLQTSISVKRAWGEYSTPIGTLRFGRMPENWGMGMLYNSGDHYDSDYQTTVDRIMFMTGIKSLDLYFGAAWDFPNEGAISQTAYNGQGQPYDLAQLDDVSQYTLIIVRRRNPALQRLDLAQGNVVVNGGLHFSFRNQFLADDAAGGTLGQSADTVNQNYVRRNAYTYTPDLWLQILYKKFRFEAEGAMIAGRMESTTTVGGTSNYINTFNPNSNGWNIRQFGVTTDAELRAMEDKLRINFGFGWASGDSDLASLKQTGTGLAPQLSYDRTYSEFSFHPDYRVDLIFFRNIMNGIQGAYYFRPSAEYDISRSPNGQRFGGGVAVIWSRASEFVQAPGHKRDLGAEIDVTLYFQSKDGALNDAPDKMGGFYTMLQYGVFFPFGGMGYMAGDVTAAQNLNISLDTSAAQTLRWYSGIFF